MRGPKRLNTLYLENDSQNRGPSRKKKVKILIDKGFLKDAYLMQKAVHCRSGVAQKQLRVPVGSAVPSVAKQPERQ